jgi:hypothetical protein
MVRVINLRVDNDSDTESPMEWDGSWKLVSFSNSRTTDEPGERYVKSYDGRSEIVPATIGLRRKLDVGLAFWLACYQHGNEVWSLRNEGPQCQWDTCNLAGILLWPHKPSDMGAKTLEDRAKDARGFLETYNQWLNGDCYWYSMEDIEGDLIDSCGGFIGSDSLVEALKENLQAGDLIVPEDENTKHWLDYHHLGVEVVDEDDDRVILERARLVDAKARRGLAKAVERIRGVDEPWQE